MQDKKIVYTDELGREHKLNDKKSSRNPIVVVLVIVLSFLMGVAGSLATIFYLSDNPDLQEKLGLSEGISLPVTKTEKVVLEESSAFTDAVEKVSPAVVSISTSTNVIDYFGRSYEETGGGTGFIVTSDGLIATNRHVVEDENAIYTVFTIDGKDYEAEIVAIDTVYDLAIIKINASGLPTVELGDSDSLRVGNWVMAIGNALAEFDNTVTVGVLSAKERNITATGGGQSEDLSGLLQIDAAINSGNSGGPLINTAGQVVGINTAVASGAENIGFAIAINSVKNAIESVQKTGEIRRPMLGVRYLPVTKEIAEVNSLDYDYGAWVLPGSGLGEAAVVPGSPADKADIVENDIILEVEGQRVDESNSLARLLSEYEIGQEIELKILHKGDEKNVKVVLDEME